MSLNKISSDGNGNLLVRQSKFQGNFGLRNGYCYSPTNIFHDGRVIGRDKSWSIHLINQQTFIIYELDLLLYPAEIYIQSSWQTKLPS